MNKKLFSSLIILTLTFAIIVGPAHSEEKGVTFSGDLNKVIKSNEFATFEITVTNHENQEDIQLKLEQKHDWETLLSKDELVISRTNEKTVEVKIYPPNDVEVGFYEFTLTAFHGDESVGIATIVLGIGEDLTPITLDDLEIDSTLLPGQTIPITIVLTNDEFEPQNNVKITITSKILEEPFSVTKSFGGKETQSIAGELTIAPFLDANKYTLFVRAANGEQYTIFEKNVNIPKEGSMVTEEDVSYGFLKTKHTVTLTNKANYALDTTYAIPMGGISRFFTFVSPEVDRDYEFDIKLASGESKTVYYTVNYLPLVLGFILLALLVFWFYSRKKCSIHKRVLATKGADGKKLVKVTLIAKNKSYRPLTNLRVTDRVPASLKIVHKASSMRPDIVKQQSTHAALTWKIPKLGPREQRVISYYMRAGVKLIGKVSLPPAELAIKGDTYISNTALLRAM